VRRRRHVRGKQDRGVLQVCERAARSPQCRDMILLHTGHRAMMRAMRAAAGRQQHLRPRQVQRGRAGDQQQHPAGQEIGNQAPHP
jgi:hypothetical protein